MTDDGKDHGNDRRNGDPEGSRHYEQRRDLQWAPPKGFFVKLAGGVAALVFLITFLLKATGWGLTGSADAIRVNSTDISELRASRLAADAVTSTNTLAIAAVTAASASQSRDIADLKANIASLLYINCGIYSKVYTGAPPLSECVKVNSSP